MILRNVSYHIVSHTHWDREWYKSFDAFRAMLVNMVDDLIELLEKKSFKSFLLDGQTSVIEDYLEIRPEQKNELKKLIRAKRLFVGPWFVLPDEFLVSAESLVRNLLMGRKVAEKFGGGMDVGYLPDSFGHIAMMPSILRGFGIDTAVVYRGFGGEAGQESSEYYWTSPDGTRCLMAHLPKHGYSGGYFAGLTDAEIVKRFGELKKEIDSRATTSHRLVMNGGDHHWPDPETVHTLDLLRDNFRGKFLHSNLPDYFKRLSKEAGRLKEITGELRFGYRYAFAVMGGVYSSRMYLKQANWHTELLLERYAEPLHAMAVASRMKSQGGLLRQAWKNLLHNHPHDSICGCSIDAVHDEMMTRFQSAQEIGKAVVDASLKHLVPSDGGAIGDDRSLYLFNPSPFGRSEAVPAHVDFHLGNVVVGLNPRVKPALKPAAVKGFRLLDMDGKEVPYQIVHRGEDFDIAYSNYGYPKQTKVDRFRILVEVDPIPPLGFKRLSIVKTKKFPIYPSSLKIGRNFLENDNLRVEVSNKGAVTIIDRVNENTYGGLNVFEDTGDVGDEYNYSYPEVDTCLRSDKHAAKIVIAEYGPQRAALRITQKMSVPVSATADRKARSKKTVALVIITTIRLTANSRALECETTIVNTAKDHRLRVLFPSGINTGTACADSQYCIVARKQKRFDLHKFRIEHPAQVAPMQRFVTVKDLRKALTILSYGMPEYELKLDGKGTIALTLLRCVGLLAGDDLITRPGGKAGWHNETPDAQCPGTHTFRYAVLPHSAKEYEKIVNRESERFHLPVLSMCRKNNAPPPPADSFFSLSPGQLVVSAIKEAEDGRGTIIRIYNPTRKEIEASMTFHRRIQGVSLVRLDETLIRRLDTAGGHSLNSKVPPMSILSFRIVN